jgi:hypothetical protein
MRAFRVVEPKRICESVEDGLGGAAEVSAFEPVLVLDAETGERRHLFAAQPRHATLTERLQAGLFRRDPRSPGCEEIADFGLDVHIGSVGRLPGSWGALSVRVTSG